MLITSQDLEHEPWPRERIDEFFVMPFANLFKQPDITNAVSFLARSRKIDRIIALDDFDVETVADLASTCACRAWAAPRPATSVTSWPCASRPATRASPCRISSTCSTTTTCATTWPRARPLGAEAPLRGQLDGHPQGQQRNDELWPLLDELGDRQSYYVLERFVPGDVFHVDSVVWNKHVLFTVASQ